MTEQINPRWVAYNNLLNEGAEGYNPYQKYIQVGDVPQWYALDDKRARLMRIMEGTSTSDTRYSKMESEIRELEAAIKISQTEGI